MHKPEKIISGGQTGADIGGLCGAERCGIPTGGCAPKGYLTEKGSQEKVLKERFGLVQHPSPAMAARTKENVEIADATVIIATNADSDGTRLTMKHCDLKGKKYLLINPSDSKSIERLKAFLDENEPRVLNVAGNRESISPGLAKKTADLIHATFSEG